MPGRIFDCFNIIWQQLNLPFLTNWSLVSMRSFSGNAFAYFCPGRSKFEHAQIIPSVHRCRLGALCQWVPMAGNGCLVQIFVCLFFAMVSKLCPVQNIPLLLYFRAFPPSNAYVPRTATLLLVRWVVPPPPWPSMASLRQVPVVLNVECHCAVSVFV